MGFWHNIRNSYVVAKAAAERGIPVKEAAKLGQRYAVQKAQEAGELTETFGFPVAIEVKSEDKPAAE